MKIFTLLCTFVLSLYSADIDRKLYEGNNTVAYHQEVSKLIDQEPSLEPADKERIATERMILAKLATMLSFTPKISAFPKSLLPDDQNITTKNYLAFFNSLTDIYVNMETLKTDQTSDTFQATIFKQHDQQYYH